MNKLISVLAGIAVSCCMVNACTQPQGLLIDLPAPESGGTEKEKPEEG